MTKWGLSVPKIHDWAQNVAQFMINFVFLAKNVAQFYLGEIQTACSSPCSSTLHVHQECVYHEFTTLRLLEQNKPS